MRLVHNMLKIVMDGINDTGMMAGYAEEAFKHPEHKDAAEWFAMRARTRLTHLEKDWKDVHEELVEHKHDDELLDALSCHVNHSIDALKARIEKM